MMWEQLGGARTVKLVVLMALALPLIVRCLGSSKELERERAVQKRPPHYGTTTRQCAGLAAPHGWIWIGSETNTLPGCGDYPRNVALIKYVEGAPAGTVEETCTGSPVPAGWTVVRRKTEEKRCGSDFPDNITVIQRLGGG
jgi:hypothetical protein